MQENERNMTQGEKIAYLRKQNGMTQADLGVQLNVSYQAVSKWERDESYPDFDTISRIAKIFNVPIQFFEKGIGCEILKESAPASVPAHVEEEEKSAREPKLVGLCKSCGKAVYEGDGVKTNIGILCNSCLRQKQKQAEEAKKAKELKQAAHKERVRWRRNAGLITAGCITLFCILVNIGKLDVLTMILGSLFLYTFTAQLFWNGAVKNCTFAGGHVIGSPGLIFTFDLDGVLWLIGMKLLFAVLRFFIWLFTVVACAVAAYFISPFTFVPALIRVNNGEMEFDDEI